jgi:hypothetical protein
MKSNMTFQQFNQTKAPVSQPRFKLSPTDFMQPTELFFNQIPLEAFAVFTGIEKLFLSLILTLLKQQRNAFINIIMIQNLANV